MKDGEEQLAKIIGIVRGRTAIAELKVRFQPAPTCASGFGKGRQ
jgi:hypothetical protein